MLSADEKAAWQDIAYRVGPKFIAEKFFALYLMKYGMKFVELGQGQVSPSSYLYVSHARMAVPIGGLLLFLQSVTMMGRAMLDFLEYDVSE